MHKRAVIAQRRKASATASCKAHRGFDYVASVFKVDVRSLIRRTCSRTGLRPMTNDQRRFPED
jgi:hypothetical protein